MSAEPSQAPLPIRHAARVLLVDEHQRVLLFRSHVREFGGGWWYPVGGAVEDGETHEQAAIREAYEETGLSGLELGPEIFRRRFVFNWRQFTWDAHERWFIAEVANFEPVFHGMEDIEIDDFSDCRWLSVDELIAVRDGGDRLAPSNLPELLAPILADGPPAVPIEVGE